MDNKPKLSHHEAMELHELMNNYMVEIKHINEEISKVQNEELKNFMEDSLNNKVTKLQEINDFFNNEDQQQSEDNSEDEYGSQNQDNGENQDNAQNKYQYKSSQYGSYNNSSSSSSSSGSSS